MAHLKCITFVVIILLDFIGCSELIHEWEQACLHNPAGKRVMLSFKEGNKTPQFSIDFFVPVEWLSSDDMLLISSDIVDIALVPPSMNYNYFGNINTEYLDYSLLSYGWNRIYVKAYNASFYTVEKDGGKIILEGANRLNISETNELQFKVTGLFSVVDCNQKNKFFRLEKSSSTIPLVFTKNKVELWLLWDYTMEAIFAFGGQIKFLCENSDGKLRLADVREDAKCKIYRPNGSTWNIFDVPLSIMKKGFRQAGDVAVAEVVIHRYDNSNDGVFLTYGSDHSSSLLPLKSPDVDEKIKQETHRRNICGINTKKSLERRIVGGKPADPKDWPWMASITKVTGSHFCGGTLITDRHILTAAHCFVSYKLSEVKVRLGEYNFDSDEDNRPTDFNVIDVRKHARFNATSNENDIAILLLDRPAIFNEFIQPACITPPNNDFVDQFGYVIGWGTIAYGGPESKVLKEVVLPVWKQQDCIKAYTARRVFPSMMCIGDPAGGKDSCQGDSGGPFLTQIFPETRWYVVGIVSWASQCALPNRPGVYTRVNRYLDWIKDNSHF